VLHDSYWTRLENMDYSLNIFLHLPEREHQESTWKHDLFLAFSGNYGHINGVSITTWPK
jgi:hypothetical protein